MNQPTLPDDASTLPWLLFLVTAVLLKFALAWAMKTRRLLDKERLEVKNVEVAPRGRTVARWQQPEVRLEDVGGLGDLRKEIISFINKFQVEGDEKLPPIKGILIGGPPDVGKTSLALAIAQSLKREVCQINCALLLRAPEQISSIFHEACERDAAVAVLFDDLDFIGRAQGTDSAYVDDNRIRGLLTFLEQLDELSNEVLVLGTAERIDLLDTALMRPGRFEQTYEMQLPNAVARYDILQRLCARYNIHCQPETLKDVAGSSGRAVAGGTNGFSGADLEALLHKVTTGAKDRTSDIQTADWAEAIRDLQSLVTRRSANFRGEAITRSLAALARESQIDLNSICGLAAIKAELGRLAQALGAWTELKRQGCELPKGVLLEGPPGVGKTTLARALAGSAGVPFYSISAAEFIEVYVGVGAARVRDTFRVAKLQAPSVLFIDEIDALGSRGHHDSSGERHQTLNQLLVELDGCQPKSGVLVIAATNAVSAVDSALLRPGRFDYTIRISEPSELDKVAIFKTRLRAGDNVSPAKLEQLFKTRKLTTGADIDGLFRIARFHSFLDGHGGIIGDAYLDHALQNLASGKTDRTTASTPSYSTDEDDLSRKLEPDLFLRRRVLSK